MTFALTSPDIAEGQKMSQPFLNDQWGVGGENRSPELRWSGAPEGTKSFAVTCYDPDAPTGSGFWHWLVIDLPASATGLPRGVSKDGVGLPGGARQTRTDAGAPGYIGPAPPPGLGDHRYVFTVHALGVEKLADVGPDPMPAMVGFNMHFATLGTATLTGVFGR